MSKSITHAYAEITAMRATLLGIDIGLLMQMVLLWLSNSIKNPSSRKAKALRGKLVTFRDALDVWIAKIPEPKEE